MTHVEEYQNAAINLCEHLGTATLDSLQQRQNDVGRHVRDTASLTRETYLLARPETFAVLR